jgi:dipeptidyl aminopeptidase/acylaminoacyl peptidase
MGVRYVTERPEVKWIDGDFEKIQALVDASLEGTINMIQSVSTDERLMLVFAFSDRDPGTYYLYNREKGELTGLLKTRAWIKPEEMGQTYPIKYAARDGLEIHGYLTVPPGCKPRDLPVVIMPHGGPWVRDVWGFNPLVQLLATRGYAVLQMNYRGSTGYGREFSREAEKEVGAAIQNDIEDATRWAIAKKIADPKRIAIVGGSYGGYSALYALGKSPGLYRCGISINGVTDWVKMFKQLDEEEYKFAREHWVEQIGDPAKDEQRLQAISPVTFASEISAPVLIVQGTKDLIVPVSQAKRMVSALEGAGRTVQTLYLAGMGHNISGEKARIEMFKRIEAFLAENLPITTPMPVGKDG